MTNQPKRDSLREQLKHCIGACMCSPKVKDCLYWDIPKTMGLDTPEHGELQVNKLFALFQQQLTGLLSEDDIRAAIERKLEEYARS